MCYITHNSQIFEVNYLQDDAQHFRIIEKIIKREIYKNLKVETRECILLSTSLTSDQNK